MTLAHILDDFTLSPNPKPLKLISEEILEEHRLSAFELGYSAGWDDSISSQENSADRVSEALLQSLQELDFTYQEALSEVTKSLSSFFEALVDKILPEIVSQAIGHIILEQLNAAAGSEANERFFLNVSAVDVSAVKAVLAETKYASTQIEVNPDLNPGQVCFRMNDGEREFDATKLLQSLRHAFAPINFQTNERVENG
ncbi:MAG: hypothetical protein ACU0BB_15680 [Paracoccaceae bacterium]